MKLNKEPRTVFNDAEDLAHPTECGPVTSWLLGVFVPICITVYSVRGIMTDEIKLLGKSRSMTITGPDVLIFAAAYIALAAFMHCHYFWSSHPRWWLCAQRLKVLSILIFLPCLLFGLYRQFGF
jgi:hypothetical protein